MPIADTLPFPGARRDRESLGASGAKPQAESHLIAFSAYVWFLFCGLRVKTAVTSGSYRDSDFLLGLGQLEV